jgi:hypothetical protein
MLADACLYAGGCPMANKAIGLLIDRQSDLAIIQNWQLATGATPTAIAGQLPVPDEAAAEQRQALRDLFWCCAIDSSSEIEQCEAKARQVGCAPQVIQQRRKQGICAATLGKRLESVFHQHGEKEALAWLESQKEMSERVRNFLLKRIGKMLNFRAKKQASQPLQPPTCTITPPSFTSHHPNSLPHLKANNHWEVYIDETGSRFRFDDNDPSDKQLGKVAALAIPHGVSLPPCRQRFTLPILPKWRSITRSRFCSSIRWGYWVSAVVTRYCDRWTTTGSA